MPSQENRPRMYILKSDDGKFIVVQKKKTENGTLELKLCTVERQPISSVPSVQIHHRESSRAFIFQYDNKNYYLTVEKNKLKLNEGIKKVYCFTILDLGTGEHYGLQTQSTDSSSDLWYISKDHEQNVLILTTTRANCVRVKVEDTTNS